LNILWKLVYSVIIRSSECNLAQNFQTRHDSFIPHVLRLIIIWFGTTHPEDGSGMDLRNVGILPQHYTVSKLRRSWP